MEQIVTVINPENMNLLGLLMKGFFENRLQDETVARKASELHGAYHVTAGKMDVTLLFDKGNITIERGRSRPPLASIKGSMDALLGMITGKGYIWPVLTFKVRIGGNPLALLPLLPVMIAD